MDYDKTLEYWEELRKPLPGWCNRPAVIEDLIVVMFKIYPKYMYNKYTRMSIAWKKWLHDIYFVLLYFEQAVNPKIYRFEKTRH